ncbi:MAG TPA: phosphatase PAP2 family protein [Tepidisphaeraceae bacterium]|jgi:membrane-associated phospholipid phosphatase|nr:phosphatase PAP2 family protein [Tepidisphaeraceae bacterium]
MNVMFLISLLGVAGAMMALETWGLPTTLSLSFKGDIKRETRWLAQYGQSVCTPVAALLVLQLDPRPWRTNPAGVVLASVIVTSVLCTFFKRLLSRVRPGRENAGKFLGPRWRHDNYKESFPSSHSACAVTLSVLLASLYPQAAITFWALAVLCAGLRYLMDAHWPSDVLAGIALGYAVAMGTIRLFPKTFPPL